MSKYGSLFGSHGMNHIPITLMNNTDLQNDLKKSKIILEDLTGKEIKYFSPPFGLIKEKQIEKIFQADYQYIMLQATPQTVNLKEKYPDIIRLTNSIYKIDTIQSINRKLKANKNERIKEHFIHSCSIGTVVVNYLLRRYN